MNTKRHEMDRHRKILNPDAVYFTDNGRPLCGEHCGTMAQYTGRDISGQAVEEITPAILREAIATYGADMAARICACESCGRQASALWK